jgi:acyl-CoA synthetase (AMP-forming)/AMP-acid ligase II
MMHAAGVYFLLNAFTEGAVPVLVRRFDAGTVLDAMRRHRATTVFGLPFMCDALVREQRLRPRQLVLRTATVAGDVCPTEVETAFEDVFGVPLLSFWAATEDVGATITDRRVGPYLRVIEQADLRIMDTDGEPVGEGEVGELVTSSPTTSPGYWAGEHDVTPLGAFRSGDLVREVEPGLLRYMGRRKDVIVRGGSNVSPAEVEDALRADPAVADVGVAGLPDDELGQRIGAVLVLRGSARSAQDVLESVRIRLADHKVPERVAVVDSIPRNALTKIDRAAVGEILGGPRGVSGW